MPQVPRQKTTAGETAKVCCLWFVEFVRAEDGQDLAEYALLLTFIALVCMVGMQQLGTAINNSYTSLSTSIAS
jgi:Flp pilus assembly pilin Flp